MNFHVTCKNWDCACRLWWDEDIIAAEALRKQVRKTLKNAFTTHYLHTWFHLY